MISLLNWPLAVVLLGVVAILVFRPQLARLIDRMQQIKAPGVAIQAAAAQTGSGSAAQESAPKAAEELRKMFDNQIVVEREELILTDLNKRQVHGPDREKFLLRFASAISFAWQFENIYNLIFGSQLALLHQLNTMAPLGVPIADARRAFDAACRSYPDFYKTYSFDQWMAFLQGQALILRSGNDRVSITVAGREFLKYLVERGYGGKFG